MLTKTLLNHYLYEVDDKIVNVHLYIVDDGVIIVKSTEGTEDLVEAETEVKADALKDSFIKQLKENPCLKSFDFQ